MNDTQLVYPEWTEIRQKIGLDPLGMQNSSVNLYQRLVPGIGNVTLRIRYYGFYAWLASRYAREIGNTASQSWQRFVRRGEALYALIAQLRGDEGGMAGVQWAQRALSQNSENIDFTIAAEPGSAEPYLKQAWGAYGLAYASQLFEIGLYARVEGHDIPVPSTQWGEAIASAFASAVGASADDFFEILQRGRVSRAELTSLAGMTPSGIAENSQERQLYEDMLFAAGDLQRPDDLSRRQTLRLLLQVAEHLKTMPTVPETRWLMYACAGPDSESFDAKAELKNQQQRWWVYHANDLLHFSYETLLKYSLDTLDDYPTGIAVGALLGELVSALPLPVAARKGSWRDFLLVTAPAPNANLRDDNDAERCLVEQITRRSGPTARIGADEAWAAIRLLAMLVNRTGEATEAIGAEFAQLSQDGFHSLLTENAFLRTLLDEPLPRAIERLIEERVVQRHLWVAYRKFRYQNDYTFLFESDDGRVRCRNKSGPVLTNPRLGPAITFIQDIHLIGVDGLTPRGKALLEAA